MSEFIPLSHPDITDAEIRAVVTTLKSGRLSIGPQVEEFERLVARRAGRTHGIAVSSGTAGLHLGMLALGIKPGDEVITPAFSFVASANCIEYVGAKPVFVDCDPRTLNMRPEDVEAAITDKTRAIVGVEVFGNPAGMMDLARIATKHEIPMLEDACEGLGGKLGSEPIGKFGRIAVFGFYPNKQITTGEGGMIVTNDDRCADLCRSLRNQGRYVTPSSPRLGPISSELGTWLDHQQLGYNYRMAEINASLGVAQIKRLDQLIEARQRIAQMYMRRLMGNPDIILPTIDPDVFMSWFVFVVRLSDRYTGEERDWIIEGLRRHDVGASNYFPPIPLLPHYRRKYGYKPGDFPVAESVSQRTLALPFFPSMTEREVDLVCQTLEIMLKRLSFTRE